MDYTARKQENNRLRGHLLMTDELRQQLPAIYSQDDLGDEAVAQVKYFTPDSGWTWYASEFDGDDSFFGLVFGVEVEFGYFSLSELEIARGSLGLPVERDLYYKPTTFAEIKRQHSQDARISRA